MRIVTTSITKNRTTAITIEADSVENLAEFEAMLGSHRWIRQNEEGELESAPAHRDPPIVYDKDIDPIWSDKPVEIRCLRDVKEKDKMWEHRSFYIQSIGGYGGRRGEKAQKLVFNGFVPLRSKRSMRDGKCWEVWYLPGAWAAEGELRGKKEKEILDWVLREIKPGTTELSGETYALCLD